MRTAVPQPMCFSAAALLLCASAESTVLSNTVFECTSASYCDPCTNDTTQIQMSGSTRSLMGNSTGEKQLQLAVHHMVETVNKRFGNVSNDVESHLHLSFQYLCCYNKTELQLIARALSTVRWQPVPVRFSRVVCAADMVIALADPSSQGALFSVVSAFEEAADRAGVPIHTRFRAEQAPFHASLFNARPKPEVDIRDVVATAQATVPLHGLNSEPILVDSFEFNGVTIRAS